MKRTSDLLLGALALLAALPIMAVAAIAVWATMGRPMFFRQVRPGLNGRPFEMLKLRTMRDVFDAQGRPLPDADRLTRLGRFLRAASIDELPELINVLRGEMSLVGPRPLLMEYLSLYSPAQARRHEVKPGITGLAQVSGRNAISWDERLKLDVWYVDHWSLGGDLRILLRTIVKVVLRDGVSASAHATMPKFGGTSEEPLRQPGEASGSSTARTPMP